MAETETETTGPPPPPQDDVEPADDESDDGGGSFLNNRRLRLTILLLCIMCYIFPNLVGYGFNNIQEFCPRFEDRDLFAGSKDDYDDFYNSCQLKTAGYILSFIVILVALVILNLPNFPILSGLPDFMDGMVGMVIRIVLGALLAICALLLLAGEALYLSWYSDLADNDDGCVLCHFAGLYMLGYIPMFLVAADLISDYGSNQAFRIISFAVNFMLGMMLLMAYYYNEDFFDPDSISDSKYGDLFNLWKSGLVFMLFGSIAMIVLQLAAVFGLTKCLPDFIKIFLFRGVACFFGFALILLLVSLSGFYENASSDLFNTSESAFGASSSPGWGLPSVGGSSSVPGTPATTGFRRRSLLQFGTTADEDYPQWPLITGAIIGDFMCWPLTIFSFLIAFDFASSVRIG